MESIKDSQGFWQNKLSPGLSLWILRFFIVLTSVFWLGLVAANWTEAHAAEDVSESYGRSSDTDEYNFNWLDPDKKIYVLQNRKYVKKGHPIVSLMGGGSLSNPFRNVLSADGRFAYYASEWLGVELFYTQFFNSPNSVIQALAVASPNALPSVREIRSQVGGMIHFVPWYAKINVFNSILYFDWYFGVGLGSISSFVDTRTRLTDPSIYTQQNLLGLYLSTGHEYYLSQNFIFRLDVTGAFYSSPINGLTGDSSWYTHLNFAAGLGWRL